MNNLTPEQITAALVNSGYEDSDIRAVLCQRSTADTAKYQICFFNENTGELDLGTVYVRSVNGELTADF